MRLPRGRREKGSTLPVIIDQLAYVFGHVIALQPMSVPKFTDYLDFISSWMTVGPPVRRKLLVVVTGRQLFGSGWWTTTATTGNGQHYRAGPNLSVLVGYKSQRRVRILQICRNSAFERKKSDVARRWETTSCIQHAQRSRVPKLLKFENTLDTTTTFGPW